MVYPLQGVGQIIEYNLDHYLHMQKVEMGMGANPVHTRVVDVKVHIGRIHIH